MDKQKKQSKTVKPVHKAYGGSTSVPTVSTTLRRSPFGSRTQASRVQQPVSVPSLRKKEMGEPVMPRDASAVPEVPKLSPSQEKTAMLAKQNKMIDALKLRQALPMPKASINRPTPLPTFGPAAEMGMKGMKKGGSVKTSTRGAGSESRGKKTRFV